MEIVKLRNVEKVYNGGEFKVQALKEVDLTINKSEFLVISGQSGSGKTTLLNIIGTLDTATRGDVYIEGVDVRNKSDLELSELRLNRIGFIFQAYNLIPVLSALENIEFTMMLRNVPEKIRHEKALKTMDELGIAELANKRPNQMSGGQQQRVAVARAIVNDPLLVLADEPTANLDFDTGAILLDIMERMNKEKDITFVFSSHDEQVMDRGKRLLKLKDGEIVDEEIRG